MVMKKTRKKLFTGLTILFCIFAAILVAGCEITGSVSASSNSIPPSGSAVSDVVIGDSYSNEVEIFDIKIVPNPVNNLAATITFNTSLLSTAQIFVQSPEGESWTVGPTKDYSTHHKINILGMLSDSKYYFTINVKTAHGKKGQSNRLGYRSGSLPADLPSIILGACKPEMMQPGMTLMNLYKWSPYRENFWGRLIMVDQQGRIVWYFEFPALIMNTEYTSRGTIVFNAMIFGAVEIDMMGNIINTITSYQAGQYSMHHELMELPWGDFMVLGSELRQIDGYPTLNGEIASYNVVGDVIGEFNFKTGHIKSWSLFDYLDPMRVRDGFFDTTFWSLPYWYVYEPKDWTHSNAIVYDSTDNSFIVSVRNQDWLVKIDMETDEMVWRLGRGGDFDMAGNGKWQFHQHAPAFMPNGNIIIYDNGNTRYLIGNKSDYTRVVEFAVDEQRMIVHQVWEYRGEIPYFAPFLGDVDPLENGNILITDGGLVESPDHHPMDPINRKLVRIVEVTHQEVPEKVFEIYINDFTAGYSVYRAERIPSLHTYY